MKCIRQAGGILSFEYTEEEGKLTTDEFVYVAYEALREEVGPGWAYWSIIMSSIPREVDFRHRDDAIHFPPA